jgi:DnaJ-class molecular chaperone
MLGSHIELKAPGGRKIAVKFPPGTQHGSVHAVRGMGLRTPDGHRGDFLVQFLVRIPTIAVQHENEIMDRIAAHVKEIKP